MRRERKHVVRRPAIRAFTLVELLVVIGIIAVLVGILLPTLARARQQGNLIKCQSNLRSLGQALVIYCNENKGVLPFGDWNPPGTTSATATRWYMQIQHLMDSKAGTTWNEAAASGSAGHTLREVFLCPEVPTSNSPSQTGAVHYMCHPRLMPQVDPSNGPWSTIGKPAPKPYKIDRIRRSTEIALLFDCPLVQAAGEDVWRVRYDVAVAGHIDKGAIFDAGDFANNLTDAKLSAAGTKKPEDSIDMTPMNTPDPPNSDAPSNTQTIRFRHRGNKIANVLMADGHVESFEFNTAPAANDPRKTSFLRKNLYVNK